MGSGIRTPVTIYIVHHPECKAAEKIAGQLYDWFRLGHLSGDTSGAGLPVYFRRQIDGKAVNPTIQFNEADLNVVIALVDHRMVGDADWRKAMVELAKDIDAVRKRTNPGGRALLLPAAMHDSFYRTGPLYEHFNPVRLLKMGETEMQATVRRAATEATARMLRTTDDAHARNLDVFLSHAKLDGREIAESIRDGVRSFGQLVAWYDANDLPFGSDWKSPMEQAAEDDTAAMVVTLTDAYPTRPWCRREATLARTPKKLTKPRGSRVWIVQPVIAIQKPGSNWVRGVPMLEGVPRIGWSGSSVHADTGRVVDRLVLEVLLGRVHRRVAQCLDDHRKDPQFCYITWVPDAWTLAVLRKKCGRRASSIRQIVYPGYGMTTAEIAELGPVIELFHKDARLVSFEEAWP